MDTTNVWAAPMQERWEDIEAASLATLAIMVVADVVEETGAAMDNEEVMGGVKGD